MLSFTRMLPSLRIITRAPVVSLQMRPFSQSIIPFNELHDRDGNPKKFKPPFLTHDGERIKKGQIFLLKKKKLRYKDNKIPSRMRLTPSMAYVRPNRLPPRPTIDESEFEEVFIKGGGPGGQKINKTSSKVQLRHKEYGIVVNSQESRSREQNRKTARLKLAMEVEAIRKPGWNRKIALELYNQKKGMIERKKTAKSNQKMVDLKRRKDLLQQREEEARSKMIDPDLDYELLEYQPAEIREQILAESREKMLKRIQIEEADEVFDEQIAGVYGQIAGTTKFEQQLEQKKERHRNKLERRGDDEQDYEIDFEITGETKSNRNLKRAEANDD